MSTNEMRCGTAQLSRLGLYTFRPVPFDSKGS